MTWGCARTPLPRTVAEAQAVSQSKAGQEAQELAPQAFSDAEKLKEEGLYLHDEGRNAEAKAAGEQAIAAYNEAFALSQLALAQERLERARSEKEKAAQELKRLDLLQSQVEADAKAFEMQARVVLDTEPVKDTDELSGARAEARRLAAKQLAAEAGLLCLGAELLDRGGEHLTTQQQSVVQLEQELNVGSVKTDLYPRAAEVRAACLKEITLARRPRAQKAPQSAASDELLAAISKAGKYMVYRDDRGVVVNLGQPLVGQAGNYALSDFTKEALQFLGATAKTHSDYPLLVVVHTKSRSDSQRSQAMEKLAAEVLTEASGRAPVVRSVGNAQPVVLSNMGQASEKNERVEVVFVVPGR